MNQQILSEKRKYRIPNDSEIDTLYRFYILIFNSSFALSKKRAIMTAVLGYETWSWRVVAITKEAVKAIARNGYRKPTKMLARDHEISRALTYKQIFERKTAMTSDEWWSLVWENDKTTLMTNDEHHSKNTKQVSGMYKINPEDSYFIDAPVAGWYQSKNHEGKFIEQLVKDNDISLN